MRNRYWIAGLMSLAVAVVLSLSTLAVAQSDTTAPGASSPQSPSQSSPSQSSPSTTPQDQSSAPSASQAPSQRNAPAQASEDNPLGLTEDQKAQLRPIVMEENQQMEAVRNDTSLTQQQKIAKTNQIREAASPKIKAILTPEQLQKLAEMQKARQQQENQSAPPSGSQKPPQ